MKKIPIALRKDHQNFYIGLLSVSLAIFIYSAWLASVGRLLPWEKSLLLEVYDIATWLRPVGIVITQFGSVAMVVIISLIFLTGREKSQHIGRLILANSAVTYVLVTAAKHLVGRPRPVELVQNLQQHDILVNGLGFPSGHTALVTVISLVLMPYFPAGKKWLPACWILLVGLSRVYLGVHAPLDIVGGFALGLSVVSAQRLLKIQ